MNKTLRLSATEHRIVEPLTELMRNHRRRIDAIASGQISLDEGGMREMAKSVRIMSELLEEQDRQAQPTLSVADWLGRAELQINELRRAATKGGLDGVTLQRSIEAAMAQLVAARTAAKDGRRS